MHIPRNVFGTCAFTPNPRGGQSQIATRRAVNFTCLFSKPTQFLFAVSRQNTVARQRILRTAISRNTKSFCLLSIYIFVVILFSSVPLWRHFCGFLLVWFRFEFFFLVILCFVIFMFCLCAWVLKCEV